jgi:fibronectin-binding autotransporter adhesin
VGITKFGAGTLTLSSSGNTYTGDTKVGAGSLAINHANALSGSALDLATADLGTVSFGPTITAATLGSLKGSRNLLLNNTAAIPAAVTLTVGANNATNIYTGQLSGLGHLYKSGTGTQTLDPGSAASMSLGSISANGGSLILKSGTFANTAKDPQVSLAAYNIGAGARGGTLTIDGATLNVGAGNNLKIAATTAGSLSVLSGTVTSNDIVIGHNGAGIATQSGGTVTTTNLYHQDGGAGNSYTLTGGSLTARRIYNNTASTADFTLNLNGGTLYSAASTTNLIDSQNTGAQISVLLGEGNTFIDTTASSASIVRPMGNMPAAVGTFTKAGINTLTLTGANTYTGSTTINAGTLAVGSSGSLSDASAVVVKSTGTFDVSGITASEKVASLTGEAGSFLKLGGKTLEFGNSSDTSYLGSIDSSTGGELTKTGAGKFTLAASSYTGTAPKINIALGTLLTGGANLPATTAITLSGGTLNTGTASNTVESLTVAEPSVIDFAGGGTPVLTFANRGTWSAVLQVWNWTGTVMGSGTGGQLKFSDGVDGPQLSASQVQFFSGSGTGAIGAGGVFLGTELVPVPEPATLFSSSVLMGLIVFRRRRQPGSAQVA